jgi:pantothenate kinase
LGRRICHRFGVAEHDDLARILHGPEPAPVDLGDEGVAPHVTVDVAAGAAYHLAVAHQSAAENIGKESLGGHVRWRLFHMARNATRWLTTP